MTMTAKFAGTCRNCRGRIAAGERIDWTRSGGAAHVTCPAATTSEERKVGWPSCAVCGVQVYPSGDNLACVGPNPSYGKFPGQPSGLYEYRCYDHHTPYRQ